MLSLAIRQNVYNMSGAKQLPNLDKILNIEDMDFSASQSVGSNLAAIFGTAPKGPEVDSSLRYASVKQPVVPRNPPQTVASSKSELILAKVVHAFKLQNGQYVSMGKLGIALTGYISTKTYQLILYRSKQEYFSIATINLSFLYTVQANNYSSYYDDNKENWSILFENKEACIELAREIGLSRYFSKQGKAEQPMIYQDLVAGSKDVVAKEGDKILIKYNIATQIVQPLKIHSTEMETTVQISTDLNWERLLLGACKGSRRIMIIPPTQQISLGPGFPKYNDIALEVEIIDITSAVKDDSAQPKSTPVTGKASILSRMAKMGQSILPKTPIPTTTDSEDTEEELPQKATRHKRAEAPGSSIQRKQSNSVQQSLGTHITDQKNIAPTTIPVPPRSLIPATTLVSPWVQNQIQPQYVTANGQLYPMVQPVPTAIDPNLNVFLSETRTQNTEIRMGMAKIADNVQKLLDKFHVIEVQNASTPATDKSMETTLKMLLGMNLSEPKRLELQNQKTIKDEPSDKSLMTMNEELTEKITALEGELKQAKETLIDEMECINKCEEEKRHLESANSLLNSRIELLEGTLAELRETSKKTLADFEQATESANGYKEKNLAMENKIAELTVKCSALENVAPTPKEKYRSAEKTREIKRIMNETFQALQTQFTEESYPTKFIKATLASTLRDVTLKVLKESKKDVAVSESDIPKRGSESRGKSPTDSSIKDEKKGSMDPPKLPESAFRDEPPPIPPVDLEVDDRRTDLLVMDVNVIEEDDVSFRLGEMFDSYEELENKLERFSQRSLVHYWRRDSRTVSGAHMKTARPISERLKYYSVKYACIYGGQKFLPRGAGRRQSQSIRTNCPAHIMLRASKDGTKLEVTSVNNEHNHEISEELFKNLPQERKLCGEIKQEVQDLMQLHIDRKRLKEYVRLRTNKILRSKDLFNIAAANKHKRDITPERAYQLFKKIHDIEKLQNRNGAPKVYSEFEEEIAHSMKRIKKEQESPWGQDALDEQALSVELEVSEENDGEDSYGAKLAQEEAVDDMDTNDDQLLSANNEGDIITANGEIVGELVMEDGDPSVIVESIVNADGSVFVDERDFNSYCSDHLSPTVHDGQSSSPQVLDMKTITPTPQIENMKKTTNTSPCQPDDSRPYSPASQVSTESLPAFHETSDSRVWIMKEAASVETEPESGPESGTEGDKATGSKAQKSAKEESESGNVLSDETSHQLLQEQLAVLRAEQGKLYHETEMLKLKKDKLKLQITCYTNEIRKQEMEKEKLRLEIKLLQSKVVEDSNDVSHYIFVP